MVLREMALFREINGREGVWLDTSSVPTIRLLFEGGPCPALLETAAGSVGCAQRLQPL